MTPTLNELDYVCCHNGEVLEYSLWLGNGRQMPIGLQQHFDKYWPCVFPRPPLYRIKWNNDVPEIVERIKYESHSS